MKALCIGWLALTLAMLVPSPAQARKYTLKELLEKVGREYYGVVAAREGENVAHEQLFEAYRLWAPTGQIQFGITGSPSIKCVGAGDPLTGALPDANPTRAVREANCVNTNATDLRTGSIASVLPVHGVALSLGLNILQPLYTSGKIEAAEAAARAGYDLSKDQVEAARNEARINALRAYYGLKLARAAKATLDEGRGQLGSWVKRIDAEIDKGKSSYTESDLIRLKIALDNAEVINFDFNRNLELTLAAVRYLANDPDADIDDDELDDVELVEQPLSYYEDAARFHRPEAKMLDAGHNAAVANRKLQLAQMLPDFGLLTTASYGLATGVDNPQNAFLNRPNTLGAGLYLVARQNLDFGSKLSKYWEARSQERQLDAKREQALGAIGLEIHKAWLDTIEAKGRSKQLAHAEKVARGWYHATDQALQTGVADSRDLSESARNYVELRIRRLQALMDENITLAVLRNSAGLL